MSPLKKFFILCLHLLIFQLGIPKEKSFTRIEIRGSDIADLLRYCVTPLMSYSLLWFVKINTELLRGVFTTQRFDTPV